MLNAIRDILTGNSAVTNLVQSDSIYPAYRLQATALPAVVLEVADKRPTLSKGTTSKMDFSAMRVTAFAQTYGGAYEIAEACRQALDGFSGTQSGVAIQLVIYDNEEDGYFDVQPGLHAITYLYQVVLRRDGNPVQQSEFPPAGYLTCETLPGCPVIQSMQQDIEELQENPGAGGPVQWNDIQGKPATFAPSSHAHPISDITGLQGALNAKADLVGGQVPTSQIPALAVSEFLGDVASQAAMLALTGQRGDWCIRTDADRTYFLIADDASVLANWRYIKTPASPVISVNGQTGVVLLGKNDVGLGNVDNTPDANKPVSGPQQAALDQKANSTHTHSVGDISGAQSKRLFGRDTAGPGSGEQLTLSTVLDFIGSAAQGDFLYRGASGWLRLPAGAPGQVLVTLGAADNPAWRTPLATQLDILSDAAQFQYSNAPNTEQNAMQSANRGLIRFDATNANQIRLIASVIVTSGSANSPRLYPSYSTDGGATWIALGLGTVASGDAVSLAGTGSVVTNWITIPSGAKGDFLFRASINGGDGVADPAYSNIALQVR